ncbi:MAG: lysoplasmalogenase [Leptospiraceae bacterium]|nr:lysoplasmalogenase [Leptospiraceae bacterium]
MFLIFFSISLIISSSFSMYCRYKKENWYFIAKPIPLSLMILFLLYFLIQTDGFTTFNNWILIGLIFGLLGDIFLLKERLFLFGLISFLIGHIGYTIGFLQNSKTYNETVFIVAILLALLYSGFLITKIFRTNKQKYFPAIILYAIGISIMAASGISMNNELQTNFPYFGFGVLLFTFSDSIWGYNKFVKPFYFAQIFILSTYYSAQMLFCIGIFTLI